MAQTKTYFQVPSSERYSCDDKSAQMPQGGELHKNPGNGNMVGKIGSTDCSQQHNHCRKIDSCVPGISLSFENKYNYDTRQEY